MKGIISRIGLIATALAFFGAWGFFLFAYPYHLTRREQFTLFLFDWESIRQTYRGFGWLGSFLSDFLEQFFRFPLAASLIVALLLTGIGVTVYRICRHFLGKGASLTVATLFFAWSFMRETGNLYLTRYTLVMLGYLLLVLLALRFRKVWAKALSAVLLLGLGAWALGSPYHQSYGKLWGMPRLNYERVIALDLETARENWDKVLQLSKKDLYMVEASYCYNLAHVMKGDLGQMLFNHSQADVTSFLLPVDTENSLFTNTLAGEAWFQVGDMTIAEQSAITSLQASPKHTGARYIQRLARVNLISGETAAAQKYLNMLGKSLFYRKWALGMMPGNQDEATRAQLAAAHASLARKDIVHHSNYPRQVLLNLLEVNPDNNPARIYLLCFDLMNYDLDSFMEDYSRRMLDGHIYKEAILIWLSQNNAVTEQNLAKYGIDKNTQDRMGRFFRNPDLYRSTYWYYYMDALYRANEQP